MSDAEKDLQEVAHRAKQKRETDLFSNSRLKLIPLIEKKIGQDISGDIADIGAGDGYLSIWLEKNRQTQLYSFEVTDEAVSQVIPRYIKTYSCKNIQVIKAGFEDLAQQKQTFDFVLTFGSLHHSPNIFTHVKNIYNCIKPGGYYIAQEPCSDDHVQNKAFVDLARRDEIFVGKKIRHGDRNDIFYRHCEYKSAIYRGGFELSFDLNVEKMLRGFGLRDSFKRKFFASKELEKPENFKYYRQKVLKPISRLFICRRPEKDEKLPYGF